MKKYNYLHVCFVAALLSPVFALAEEKQNAMAKPSEEGLKLTQWFALGSGCKAKNDLKGDVNVELQKLTSSPNAYSININLASYQLLGSKPVKQNPTFARECAIRVGFSLPSNMRVVSINGNGSIVYSKDTQVRTELRARLFTGETNIASWEKVSDKNEELKGKVEELNFSSDAKMLESLKKTNCGEGGIIGLDLSFINKRESDKPHVDIKMGNNKNYTINVVLEGCTPVQRPTSTPAK